MSTQEQSFIYGFVKRASEYGYEYSAAISLFKQAGAADLYHLLRGTLPKTMHAIEGGAVGGGLGAVGGGVLGAVKGLIAPGTSVNPETGESSPISRIDAMISNAGKGARIGAASLGTIGAAVGINAGRKFKKNREGLKDLFEKIQANTAAGRPWEHGIYPQPPKDPGIIDI